VCGCADYGAEYAEHRARDEDPAAPEDVGYPADDGEGYRGGEGVGEGDPDYVWVLREEELVRVRSDGEWGMFEDEVCI